MKAYLFWNIEALQDGLVLAMMFLRRIFGFMWVDATRDAAMKQF